MKAKHTPGPWNYAQPGNSGLSSGIVRDENNHFVCDCRTNNPNETTYMTRGTEEIHANAQLIAAAPELLEALKEALQAIDEAKNFIEAYVPLVDHNGKSLEEDFSWDEVSDATSKAKAAIAKAEGRGEA